MRSRLAAIATVWVAVRSMEGAEPELAPKLKVSAARRRRLTEELRRFGTPSVLDVDRAWV